MDNVNKSTDAISEKLENNNSTGEVTLEQFKNALENNIECKGYFDSLCDKSVNKRLDKGIESWKEQNLQTIIEEEINKRYPQKTESEIKFEEQQKALEQAQFEKKQLELQIQYHDLIAENNLPISVLDFVAGKDIQTTISNIENFTKLLDDMVTKRANEIVLSKLGAGAYTPGGNGGASNRGSMWDI